MSSLENFIKLYGNGKSSCCDAKVYFKYGGKGPSYHICKKCGAHCEVIYVIEYDGSSKK